MNIFKTIASRVIPVGILVFIIAAAIAYQRGLYDITFIERPADAQITVESTDTTALDITDTADTSSVTDSTEDTARDETTATPEQVAPSVGFAESIPLADSLSGYSITDRAYSAAMELARIKPEVALDRNFSLRSKLERKYTRVANETYGGYTTVGEDVQVERRAVELFMDYIVVDNGSSVTLLDSSGRVVLDGLDIDTYEPAYTRDSDDLPQFRQVESIARDGTVKYKYYRIENGSLVESDYNDAAEGRGLYFNYPADFGKGDGDSSVKYNVAAGGGYGYANEKGGMSTTYKYERAFNFSEGLAAVVTRETARPDKLMLSYINTRYANDIYCMKGIWHGWYYNEVKQRVAANYRLPDTFGEESLGFFYFENELCRVRKQEHNYWHTYELKTSDRLMTDEDIVIRSDGSVFDIPGGYRVVSYSSGIFVLEKGGKYGCYSYNGDFIADPDFDECKPFHEGLGVIGKDGKYGVIDTSGELVIPMVYDYIESCSSGVIAAYSEDTGWVLFSKMAGN